MMAVSNTLVSSLQKHLEEVCSSIVSTVTSASSSTSTHAALALQRNRDLNSLLHRLISLHSQLSSINEQQHLSHCTRQVMDARELARDSVSSCLAQLSQAEQRLSLQVSAAKQNLRRRSTGRVPLSLIIALSKNCASASCAGIRHQNHPADRQDVRHVPPFPLSQDPYFLNKYRSSLPPAHLPPLALSWSLDDVLLPWQKDIIGGFLDPNAATASPIAEAESDEGDARDYEAYYLDMDDKLSDGEEEIDGTTEVASAHKRQREQEDSSPARDGQIVVDLEEVLSPEEFEALYAHAGDGIKEQPSSSVADDPITVDQDYAPLSENDEIQPEDMALFMGQGSPS